MNRRTEVAVIGGGISGLSVAWWLSREGVDVILLEKDDSAGGTMKTMRTEGWLIEKGPNSALETTPLFNEMIDALGLTGERVYASETASNRYILRNGALHPLPMSPVSFLKSRLWSTGGKLRLLKEPFIGRSEDEESIAAFVERRLGKEFLDYAINPFVAGVYAGSPEQLSVRSAFPKLYALEKNYGGLIRGMILGRRERKRRAEKAKDRARLFSFRNGMEVFPAAIADALGERALTGCRVEEIRQANADRDRRTYSVRYSLKGRGEVIESDAIVLSVPARPASAMIDGLSLTLPGVLRSIDYPPVAEVFFGFESSRVKRELDGFGFLVPEKENRKILGSIWSSSLFDGRAPEGHAAMTTFVGGTRQPELARLEEGDLRDLVFRELDAILGIQGFPTFSSVTKWENAIPQYTLGYEKVIGEIERFENEHPGFFICSNYRGGIAVGDCIMSSRRTATTLLSYLGTVRDPDKKMTRNHDQTKVNR